MMSDMIAERVYRALLAAYPSEHRREYGEPMVQLFRDRMRRDGGGFRTLAVWVHTVFDLVSSAFEERKEGVMLESVVKQAGLHSAKLLLWSFSAATGVHVVTTVALLTAGLVSLRTGWYFTIESGPLWFLGYEAHVYNSSTSLSFGLDLFGFFVLFAAAGLLIGVGSAMRALYISLRS